MKKYLRFLFCKSSDQSKCLELYGRTLIRTILLPILLFPIFLFGQNNNFGSINEYLKISPRFSQNCVKFGDTIRLAIRRT